MSKKLCFLISFVLALGLIGTARAEPIDINNHSFEYDINGVQITEDTGWDDVQGWTIRDTTYGGGGMEGWQFVSNEWDVTGYEAADGNVCSFNVTADDPNDPNESCQVYQILEDPCAVIAENRRYTLTFNALRIVVEDSPTVYGALFYSLGGVNVPPVNDVTLASKTVMLTSPPWGKADYAGWEEVTVSYIALSGAGSIGEALGVKLSVPVHTPWLDGYQVAIDNVRVYREWATNVWDPDPADEADDVPIDVNLSWSPGLWAVDVNGHEVYFGTDEAAVEAADRFDETGIFRGPQNRDVNSYTPTESPLELGKTYYWRVDEVNEAYVGPLAAAPDANGRWKGDIWSFRTTGLAYNLYPADWAKGIPALNLLLRWAAGTDSNSHDVYFGTSWADVNSATTASDPNLYRDRQSLADVNYALEDLDVSTTYFWRIDEVNEVTATLVKGDVWRFTTGVFLNVDTFNSYVDKDALTATWTTGHLGAKNGAVLFLEKDTDFVRDGNSMMFTYMNWQFNRDGPVKYYVGSEAVAALPLEVGTDWATIGGVKALVLYFYGDPFNGKDHNSGYEYHISQDQMYVALEDGSGNIAMKEYDGDMNDLKKEEWQPWNIRLQDFNDINNVDLSDVANVYIGFGGYRTGQSAAGAGELSGKADTVWFDDIRLYPPRCMPAFTGIDVLHALGDFTEDCTTDYSDFDIMGNDWLVSDFNAQSAPPEKDPIAWYKFDEGSGTTTANSGTLGSTYDGEFTGDPNNPTWTTEGYPGDGNALDFDGLDDWVAIPALNLNSNTITITAWVKPVMADSCDQNIYSAIVYCGTDNTDAGFVFGSTAWDDPQWQPNNEVCYMWEGLYWDYHTDLFFVDNTWNFVAMAIEPTKATLYLYDGNDLDSWTNPVDHPAEEFDGVTNVGWVPHPDEIRAVDGIIDDIRIYDYTLSHGEIMGLCDIAGEVYVPNISVANLSPKLPPPTSYDPNDPDIVNFRDYRILADNWLEQRLWP